ncbi:breast cancer type 1 susceptibility protein homolog [Vespula pensylvanica]|uniref:breast cancer type 1 susceptibility protein homolog n=1 Tax=Vespula pensylvanica TaxID=30213 RepID=UPI001CBA289E|nr:breast cancer type 1 susceptibility protein homolog [Vespula pensylvanica]
MSDNRNPSFDILSEAVKSIQKCLQCSICLDMLSAAVKTKCGHSFCRPCLKPVLSRRHPKCPLCNNVIQKRHIKKNLNIQKYINHFNHLVRAIRQDTNTDILSYTRFPQNTREACTTSNRQRRSRASATITRGNRRTIANTPVIVERNTPIPLEEQPSTSRQVVEGERSNVRREQKNNTKKTVSTNETKVRRLVVTEDTSGITTRQWRRKNVSSTNTNSRQENRVSNRGQNLPNAEQFENPSSRRTCSSSNTAQISNISTIPSSSTTSSSRLVQSGNNVKQKTSILTKSQGMVKAKEKTRKKIATPFLYEEMQNDLRQLKLQYQAIQARARSPLDIETFLQNPYDIATTSIDASSSTRELEPVNATNEPVNRIVKVGRKIQIKEVRRNSLNIDLPSTSSSTNMLDDLFVIKKLPRISSAISSTVSSTITQVVSLGQEKKNELIENVIVHRANDDQVFPSTSTHNLFIWNKQPTNKYEQKFPQNTIISLEEGTQIPLNLPRVQIDDITDMDNVNISTNDDTNRISQSNREILPRRLLMEKIDKSMNSTITNIRQCDQKTAPVRVNRCDILPKNTIILSPGMKQYKPIRISENIELTNQIMKPYESIFKRKSSTIVSTSNETSVSSSTSQLSVVRYNPTKEMNQKNTLSTDISPGVAINDRGIVSNVAEKLDMDKNESNIKGKERKNHKPIELTNTSDADMNETSIVPLHKYSRLPEEIQESSPNKPTQDSLNIPLNTSIVNEQNIKSDESPKKNVEDISEETNEPRDINTSEIRSEPTGVVRKITTGNDTQLNFLNWQSATPIKLKISHDLTLSKFRTGPKRADDLSVQTSDKINTPAIKRAREDKKIRESNSSSNNVDSNKSKPSDSDTNDDFIGIKANIKSNNKLGLESAKNMPKKRARIDIMNEIITIDSDSDFDNSLIKKRKTNSIKNENDEEVKTDKKEKCTILKDSTDINFIMEIINNWCNSLNMSQNFIGANELQKLKEKLMSNKPMTMTSQSIDWQKPNTSATATNECEKPEEWNNDIIDKERSIRTNEKKITWNENQNVKEIDRSNKVDNIRDTLKNFFSDKNIVSSTQELNTDQHEIPSSTISYAQINEVNLNANTSKENLQMDKEDNTMIKNFNSSNEKNKTAKNTTDDVQVHTTENDSIMNKQNAEDKQTTLIISEKEEHENDRGKDQSTEKQKDILSDCEQLTKYDSFLNITQDQLLLNALEEDLFSIIDLMTSEESTNTKPLSQEDELNSLSQRIKPSKSTNDLEEEMNLANKDAEKIPTDNKTVKKTQQSDKKSMDTVDLCEITKVGKCSTIPKAIPSSSRSFQVEKIVTTNKTNVSSSSEVPKFQISTNTNKNKVQVCHQKIFKTNQTAHNRDEGESSSLNENEKSLESQSNSNTETVRTRASTSRQNQLKDICLIWSNLTVNQVDSVKQLSSMLSIKWTKKFNPTVTHVIVGINNDNTVTKTLKFLQGMAYKKFVVGFNWVTDCLKEETIVNEEPYEVLNFCAPKTTPPRSRNRENFFNGFTFLCIEPFRSITVDQFEDLLKALGATIVQTMDDFITAKEKYKIILVQSGVHTDEIIASWYKEIKAIIISSNWVVECISQCKLIPCYTYLHKIVQKDTLSLTYPKQMIELF